MSFAQQEKIEDLMPTISKLIYAFETAPQRMRQVLDGLSESELKATPENEKWSIKDIAIHLTDSEIIGASRIRQTYAQPGSTFAFYDQEIWADVFNYQNFNRSAFEQSLKLFEYLRSTTAPIFRQATNDDWSKTGFHPERGMMTLFNLLENYATHSEGHIYQILRIRKAIGKPLELPQIL